MVRTDDIVTKIEGWDMTRMQGHWHWFGEGETAEINLNPRQPGTYNWNCLCPAEITHNVYTTPRGSYRPGEPIFTHREW